MDETSQEEKEDLYIDVLKYCYDKITNNLRYNDIIGSLLSSYIISVEEKQNLDALQIGSISKNSRLIDHILCSRKKIVPFVKILQEKQPDLGVLIEECRLKIENGDIDLNSELTDIQQNVRKIYKEKYQLLHQIPGERFVLDISNKDLVMPLEVTAEVVNEHQFQRLHRRVEDSVKSYKKVNLSCIEGAFDPFCFAIDDDGGDQDEAVKQERSSHRLFLCTGNAGSGKTVTLQRLAWEWATSSNEYLQQFYLLFLIPLRNIETYSPVLDILGPGRRCLGYVPCNDKALLHRYLSKEDNAKRVLFALDGVDEVEFTDDSDIFHLLKGDLYPGSKIIVTTRPDADLLPLIVSFKPDVKINIHGTNKEGIFHYIQAALVQPGGPSKEDAKSIIALCEKNMFSFDVLYVPLYLTLITVVFDQYFVRYASFAKFKAPETMVQLFNSFMKIIIKLWIHRSRSLNYQEKELDFELSPLSQDSKVPVDIQGKLFHMGRMSFDFLLKRKYEFTESDLASYFVDKRDIQDSGMFCMSTEDDQCSFYFRHKTLQEYIAATYLSHMQYKDACFKDHLHNVAAQGGLITLEEYFSPLQLCMKFLFGMNPSFAADVIQHMPDCVGIAKNTQTADFCLDMIYFAELCIEGNDEILTKKASEQLAAMPSIPRLFEVYNQHCNFPQLYRLARIISKDAIKDILKAQYELDINYDGVQKVYRVSSNKYQERAEHFNLPYIDMACYALLSRFTFPKVLSITVEKSMIMDIDLYHRIFPNVQRVRIMGYPHYDISMPDMTETEATKTPSKVQKVHLKNTFTKFTRPMPIEAVENLSLQASLSDLTIQRINIFSHVLNYKTTKRWEELVSLDIHIDFVSASIKLLCEMLEVTKKLQRLCLEELSSHSCNLYRRCNEESLDTLIEVLKNYCPAVKHLTLCDVFTRRAVQRLFRHLPHLHLETLGLNEKDVCHSADYLVDALTSTTCSIKVLDIYCDPEAKVKLPGILSKLHAKGDLKINYNFE